MRRYGCGVALAWQGDTRRIEREQWEMSDDALNIFIIFRGMNAVRLFHIRTVLPAHKKFRLLSVGVLRCCASSRAVDVIRNAPRRFEGRRRYPRKNRRFLRQIKKNPAEAGFQ